MIRDMLKERILIICRGASSGRFAMKILRRISGAIAILIALSGCATTTHTPVVAATFMPTCEQTLLELNHLTTSLASKSHIPLAVPGPMHFCRYRWNNDENKLVLMADDTELIASVALLQMLSKLKTVNEVYGPNAVFPCPMMQGNADVVILRATTGSELTVIQVQRDGCERVIVTHPGSDSYLAYVSSAQLLTQLDAITPIGGRPTKNLPSIRVTPSTNLRDGERILVQVSGTSPGERFLISECANAAAANINGCGDQLAQQPFIDTDPSGAGSITFDVRARAATKPYNTTVFRPCTNQCVIMVTGTDINGQSKFVYAPLKFSK